MPTKIDEIFRLRGDALAKATSQYLREVFKGRKTAAPPPTPADEMLEILAEPIFKTFN